MESSGTFLGWARPPSRLHLLGWLAMSRIAEGATAKRPGPGDWVQEGEISQEELKELE
jgi:hypothetical protein